MRATARVTAIALLAASPLSADEDFPQIDVAPQCQRSAEGLEDAEVAFEMCMQGQALSFGVLRSLWPTLPPDLRRECTAYGRTEGSYAALRVCIEQAIGPLKAPTL
ncbi:hypothetical protein [Vannielia litorea]|uniref:hypothetical protein n=1 Tax=Vannielia litorea TaxID=1217970 RepID=UPI001C96850E|nr:hypothetical protein [Vannielia litorea]MBY6049700.1 hypothetical protein [Vannielia litorea]MBY6077114.1 hypothetical protein [Vannielia litorea]